MAWSVIYKLTKMDKKTYLKFADDLTGPETSIGATILAEELACYC